MEQSKWHMQLHEGRESALPATLEPVGYVKASLLKRYETCALTSLRLSLSLPLTLLLSSPHSPPSLSISFFFFYLPPLALATYP